MSIIGVEDLVGDLARGALQVMAVGARTVVESLSTGGAGLRQRLDKQATGSNISVPGLFISHGAETRRLTAAVDLSGGQSCNEISISQTTFMKTNAYHQAITPPGHELPSDSNLQSIDVWTCGVVSTLTGASVYVEVPLRDKVEGTCENDCARFADGCYVPTCLWYSPALKQWTLSAVEHSIRANANASVLPLLGTESSLRSTRTCRSLNGHGAYALSYTQVTCKCDVNDLDPFGGLNWKCTAVTGFMGHLSECNASCPERPDLIIKAICINGDINYNFVSDGSKVAASFV